MPLPIDFLILHVVHIVLGSFHMLGLKLSPPMRLCQYPQTRCYSVRAECSYDNREGGGDTQTLTRTHTIDFLADSTQRLTYPVRAECGSYTRER